MFESLKIDELQMNEQIGQGRFGTVYRCFSKSTDQFFACKTIQTNFLIDSTDRECLNKEAKILQLLTGKSNILQMYKVYEDENYVHIITELCSGGDLYERKSAALILIGLVSAIGHCHKLGVAHCDIKPDNVLFDSQSGGMQQKMMEGVVGTPYYVAPEVLLGRKYNEKLDIWSAGFILYIMLSGVPPFYGDTPTETFEAVLRGNLRFPTRIFRSISTEARIF
uniref:Protein kinase domain-containing protein n=1 Tax=Solanum lycopersicum TaxID=4081 RepID=A0A3Q7GKY6_SOLLC